MKIFAPLVGLSMAALVGAASACPPLLNHTLKDIDGKPKSLCSYQGKVILVVNTASKCGFTSQYKGLQSLYEKYRKNGLVVLGFPANDFGGQEPGSNAAIKNFCETRFDVSFPMFSKVGVTAANANPFHESLAVATGVRPAWNFHKYLIDRTGNRVLSFPSQVEPESAAIVGAIETMLQARPGNSDSRQAGR